GVDAVEGQPAPGRVLPRPLLRHVPAGRRGRPAGTPYHRRGQPHVGVGLPAHGHDVALLPRRGGAGVPGCGRERRGAPGHHRRELRAPVRHPDLSRPVRWPAVDPFPTALGLALLVRSKEASPVEVLEECLARVDLLNPTLNAVIWRDDDAARDQAKRMADVVATTPVDKLPPFFGVPIPIKDLTSAAGQPNTLGSWGSTDEPSTEDELIVAAFRRAGFLVTARTNAPEPGPITVTENSRYGITRNPWDAARTPGGSSGGAAAAVASGMFAVAHGNDGGGSIRIPASCCGLVGLKVSRGRVPALEESWEGASVEGVLTHTVADAAAVLDVTAAYDPLAWYSARPPRLPFREEAAADPPRLRVGMVEAAPLGMPVDRTCLDAVHGAAALLESLGHMVVPASLDIQLEELGPFLALIDGSYTQPVADWSKTDPHIQAGRERGLARSSLEYVGAIKALQRWTRTFAAQWGR